MSLTDSEMLHTAMGARRAGMLPPAALLGCHIYLRNVDRTGFVAEESFSLVLPALRELAKVLEIMIPSVSGDCRGTFRADVARMREFVRIKAEQSTEPKIRALAASVREDLIEVLVPRGAHNEALIAVRNGHQFLTEDTEFYHAYQCATSWLAFLVGDTKSADYLMDSVRGGLSTSNISRDEKRLSAHLHFRKMIDASYRGNRSKVREHFEAAEHSYKASDSVHNSYWIGLLYCSYGYSWFLLNKGSDEIAKAEAINYFRAGRRMIPDRDISCFSTIPPHSDRESYEISALAALEHEAKDKKRLKHLDGYGVQDGYNGWKERLDQKRIAILASIAGLDPILTKLALPVVDESGRAAFVLTSTTVAEVGRVYRWWRDKSIGHIILNLPLGTKMKIAQFIAKTVTPNDET